MRKSENLTRILCAAAMPRGNSTVSAYGEPVGKQAEDASAVLASRMIRGEWMEQASRESGDGSERGGMSLIVMTRDLESEEGLKIRVDARVGQSIRTGAGIFINVVNHYSPDDGEKAVQDASFAVGILRDCWESSLERAEFILDQITKLAEECAE